MTPSFHDSRHHPWEIFEVAVLPQLIWFSAGKVDFYHNIEKVDVDKEAGERGIYAKHWIERAAAHGAHIFTTISDITAWE